jgi:tetratricopeptide (TPR) repeat protein
MPGAEDQSAANDSSRDRLPEDGEGVAGPVWFGRLSQLDFDIGFYEQLLARNGNSVDVLRVLGELLSQKGLVSRALQLDERLVACLPSDFLARYNLACSLALAGRPAEAIDSLAEAIRLGYDDMAHMKVDPDLASLRGRPEFRALFGRV